MGFAPGGCGEGKFNKAVPRGGSKFESREVIVGGCFKGEKDVREVGGGAFEEEGGEESGVWGRRDRKDGAEEECIDGWDEVVSDSGEPVGRGRGGRK